MAAFGGIGAAIFAFAATRDGWYRLPLLASAPAVATLMLGQSSLYVAAGMLLPAVAFLGWSIKPNAAIIGLAARPKTWFVSLAGPVILGAVCLAINPAWPLEWLHAMRSDPTGAQYQPAVSLLPAGPLLLLAGLRWKTPEGRLLLAAAIMPQNQVFYSGLYPMLVARTYRECLTLSLVSTIGFMGWNWYDSTPNPETHQAPWVLTFIYLPALVLVLRRPRTITQPSTIPER
jgi:hypothetical protein